MNNLVDDYLRLTTQWATAMSEGDSAKANAIHDKVQVLYKDIVEAGEEDSLFSCADSEADAVRFFIASHVKERDAQRASEMYERLIESDLPFIAVSARYILREMRQ
ncbi:MAG: hypothetical protein RIK87_20005 [Fuerstiella sp.]